MKKVFVSHPYAANPKANLERVEIICNDLVGNGVLPISPLHLFSFFDSEDQNYRKDILKTCYKLIDASDIVYFYKYKKLSPGQIKELEYCKLLGVKFLIIERR